MTKNTSSHWTQKLWERKIPQYLGTYLAVGFGLFQFLQVLINRLKLSETIQDRYMIIWIALIPGVIVFLYFGFQPNGKGVYEKKKWPKFFIIGNSILAVVLALFLFNNTETSHTDNTTIIELTDEEGQEVKAIVPALKKVKSIACFQFENLTNDNSKDWLGVAMSALLDYSLEQYPEFYVSSAYNLNHYYDGLGLKSFSIPNTRMQSAIAKKSRNDYFSKVSFSFKDNTYTFKGKLVRTKDGKVITTINVINENIYAAIDDIKNQILNSLQPKNNKDIKADNNFVLPASSLISDNLKALELLTKSRITFFKTPNDLDKIISLSKQSTTIDPTCSQCYLNVAYPLITKGNKTEANTYLKNAIKYATSLPKRMQFSAKELYYNINNNVDAGIKLQEFRKEMFPYDFQPYKNLLPFYKINSGIESAKTLMQTAIDNGNREKGLLELYKLLLENEEYKTAKQTLDLYTEEFPERDQDKLKYVDLYEQQGNLNDAKKILLNEETLDPFNVNIQIKIALLDFKNADIKAFNERLEKTFSEASTLTDSLRILKVKTSFSVLSGEINNAIKLIETYEKFALKRDSKMNVIFSTFLLKLEIYQSINQSEKLNLLLEEVNAFMPNYKEAYECQINNNAIVNGYDMSVDAKTFKSCAEVIQSYGKGYNDYFNLLVYYLEEDYPSCIKILEKDNNRIKSVLKGEFFIADVYFKNSNKEKAITILKKAINQKTQFPVNYLKLAEILENENKKDEAKKYLNKALTFWANADDEYIPLKRAKALAEKLAI